MNWTENVRMAAQSIRSNGLRAVLTALIIAFGIMALVGILTAIDAIIFSMSNSFSSLGANSFEIERKRTDFRSREAGKVQKRAEPISFTEAMRFKQEYGFPATVSVSFSPWSSVVVKYKDKETNPTIDIYGVDENELRLRGLEISAGRFFSSTELQYGNPVAVLGYGLVNTLYKGKAEKAIHSYISIDGQRFRVVGTIASKGASINQGADQKVYIPLLKAKQTYASARTNYDIAISIPNPELMGQAISEAIGTMRVVRGLRPEEENDFEIQKSDDLIETIKEETTNIRIGTIVIGIMTILGAAIGLMNIMLVSVTERTKEIGIIKSIGAAQNHILSQFLLEAVFICLAGGFVGMILGILIGNIVTYFVGGSFLIPWVWMIMSMVICVIVGLLSGMYPAIKAASLDPIESLRHE